MTEDLLADLSRAVVTPATLAAKRGLTLRQLAEEAASPENRRAMAALRDMADAQADLVISRARAKAARRLIRIAQDREAPETARKACVDLLSMAGGPAARDAGDRNSPALHDEIRALLESAGRNETNNGARA